MCEHDVLEISMPFIAGHDLREFSRDATAYVATQARKAKMEISSHKLGLENLARMKGAMKKEADSCPTAKAARAIAGAGVDPARFL